MDSAILRARITERLEATGKKPVTVSKALGSVGRDYLSDFLSGKKRSIGAEIIAGLAGELGCSIDYLVDVDTFDPTPHAPPEVTVPIRGRVGASPDAKVQFASGDATNDRAALPPGGSADAIALYVDGYSMRDIADHGSLIFYRETRTPPTPDMFGQVVVVETADGDVLVKRLGRGSKPGVWDLTSNSAEPMHDVKLAWAAHILSIAPPYSAGQLIRKFAA